MADRSKISRVTRTRRQAICAYDRLSRWYGWLAAGSEQPLAQVGLRKLGVRPGETVLEIGCGTGQALLALAEMAGNTGKAYGLDISPGMISVAAKRIAQHQLSARVVYV